jgi:hypothetical protein
MLSSFGGVFTVVMTTISLFGVLLVVTRKRKQIKTLKNQPISLQPSGSVTNSQQLPPKRFLLTSNNEDYACEIKMLSFLAQQKGDGNHKQLRVLHVIGGGDTTLCSLLHPDVSLVVGLDMNLDQIQLLKLKLAVDILAESNRSNAISRLL